MQPDDQTHHLAIRKKRSNMQKQHGFSDDLGLRRPALNAFTTGNPFWGQIYLELRSIGRDLVKKTCSPQTATTSILPHAPIFPSQVLKRVTTDLGLRSANCCPKSTISGVAELHHLDHLQQ